MRVLHLHSGNLYGGVETFLATLARCRGMSPSMEMTAALAFEGRIAEELRGEGIPVFILGDVRLRRPDTVWRARRALALLLRRESFDIAICHQPWPLAVFGPTVKAAGVPLVSWVHMAQTGHWLERMASRIQPDSVFCNSRFTASTLVAANANVECVYYPVRLGVSPPRPRSKDVLIVQVSRMEPFKGQWVCLEALGLLRHEPGWRCWQVGGAQRPEEARYVEELRTTAERLGIADRVEFLGHRTDVAEILASADIFCQPNQQPEAFGISFVEALAAGVPVVTSAIGGALEIIDERCGVLLPPGDAAALAATFAHLIRTPEERQRMGETGPGRARELCDPATQMRRIASLLDQVCLAKAAD